MLVFHWLRDQASFFEEMGLCLASGAPRVGCVLPAHTAREHSNRRPNTSQTRHGCSGHGTVRQRRRRTHFGRQTLKNRTHDHQRLLDEGCYFCVPPQDEGRTRPPH